MANGILDGYEFSSAFTVPCGTDRATGEMVQLDAGKLTRHGLISGATGSGKTRTVQQLVEWLSQLGVPSVVPDPKGDLTGLMKPGELTGKAMERAELTGQCEWWQPTSLPTQLLAIGGNGVGTPVRALVKNFSYKSLGKLAVPNLTAPQSGALFSAILRAESEGKNLETVEDLRDYVRYVRDDPDSSISGAVCNRILDYLNRLEAENPGLFGGPEFDVLDLLKTETDESGDEWGVVSIIDSSHLDDTPEVLTTFLLWLLTQLVKHLPEVGDLDKPKLVFFFDEAHLMFQDAPKEFTREVVKIIKRIRSKGVGVVFISQSGADIPKEILQQVANRFQHVLWANTPEEINAVKKTAKTFPLSPRYDVESEIGSMGIGEALVSVLNDDGRFTPTAVVMVYAPRTSMEPLTEEELWESVRGSSLWHKYREMERDYREAKREASMPPEPEVRVRAPEPSRNVVGELLTRLGARRGSEPREPAVKPAEGPLWPPDPWK
jgi:uncharacterized protein